MARKGRLPREIKPLEVHIHLRLVYGEDDDLIAFFQAAAPRMRARVIKRALRSGGMEQTIAQDTHVDDDLVDALDQLLL